MRPIFNEKIAKNWSLLTCEQCTSILFTEDRNSCGRKKKKRGKTCEIENAAVDNLYSNALICASQISIYFIKKQKFLNCFFYIPLKFIAPTHPKKHSI